MNRFSFKEALLLYAISYECKHKGVATLEGIFAAEDAINRSAKTFEELKLGLTMLLSINLIEEAKQGYKTTSKGELFFKNANRTGNNVFQSLDNLTELLQTQFGKIKVDKHASLNQNEVRNAYKSYYDGT